METCKEITETGQFMGKKEVQRSKETTMVSINYSCPIQYDQNVKGNLLILTLFMKLNSF
jgi:hypothetical protein